MQEHDGPATVLEWARGLDLDAGLPLHEQIAIWIESLVRDGRLEVGQRLPAERELAAALDVSRMTLRQALASLERRGLVERRAGRYGGTRISQPVIEVDLTELPGFTHQVHAANQTASSVVLRAEAQRASDRVAAGLALPPRAEVFRVDRVRAADGVPIAVERSYFPADILPGYLDHDLSGSMYALLTAYGFTPVTAQEYLRSVVAEADDAVLLGIAAGFPLMLIERAASATDGRVVELSYDLFRSDLVRIAVRSELARPAHS